MADRVVALVLICVEAFVLAFVLRRFVLARLKDLKSKSNVVALSTTLMTAAALVQLKVLTGVNPLDEAACRTAPGFCELTTELTSVTMLIAATLLPLTYLYGWTVGSELDDHFDWNARTR